MPGMKEAYDEYLKTFPDKPDSLTVPEVTTLRNLLKNLGIYSNLPKPESSITKFPTENQHGLDLSFCPGGHHNRDSYLYTNI
jgi:hypothetical protein